MKKTIMALMATTFLMTAGAASAAINPVNIGESSSAENIYSVILDKVEAGETAGIQSGFAWAYVNGGFVSLSVNELRKHGSNAGAYFSDYVGEQVMLEFVQKTEEQIAAIEEVIYEMVTTTVEIDDVPARQAILERLSAEKTRLEAALGVATHSDAHQSQLNAATEALRVANEAVRVANAALSTMEGITATQSYLDAIGELTQGQLNINKVAIESADFSDVATGSYYGQFPAGSMTDRGVAIGGWYATFVVEVENGETQVRAGFLSETAPTPDPDRVNVGDLTYADILNTDAGALARARLVVATPDGGSIGSTVTDYTLSFAGSVDPVADSVVDAARDAAGLPSVGNSRPAPEAFQYVEATNGYFVYDGTFWHGSSTLWPTATTAYTTDVVDLDVSTATNAHVVTAVGTSSSPDLSFSVTLSADDITAIESAIDRAYDAGYSAGYEDGYADGYVVGFSDGVRSVTN